MLSNARQWMVCALVVATATWPTALWAFAGSLDLTFASDGSATTATGASDVDARGVVIQPDGKIVVVGFMVSGDTDDFALVRYQSDGSLDGSFGNGGIVTTAISSVLDRSSALALQPDGKIVVAGLAYVGPYSSFAVARYDTHGNLDPSFGSGGTVTTAVGSYGNFASSVAVQPDGMIVVAGSSQTLGGNDLAIARYDADGNLDPSFGGDGTVTTAFAGYYSGPGRLVLQGDGRIVVAGSARTGGPDFDFALARYNADGSLDPTFGGDGTVTTAIGADDDVADGMAIQADGKIVAAGGARDVEGFVLARYLPNGDLDPSWGDQGIAATLVADHASAHDVAIQPDGRVVAVGAAGYDGGQTGFAVARLESDGLPDATFGYAGTGWVTTSIGSFSDVALATALQPDGKIVAAGWWSTGSGSEIAVVRYVGSVCGNGVIEAGEQCEDGNTVGGDGCSSACLLEGCGPAPATWCHPPTPASKGSVILKDDATGDRLGWKWQKGSATSVQELGDPTAAADYLVCIYATGTLLAKAFVPAAGTCDGKPCWRASSHGFKYKSRSAMPDGVTSVLLKSGTEGHAQIAVKGKAGGLAIPAPPFAVPVTIQIERLDGSQCWEATYSAPSVNGNGQFKAKAD